MQFRPNILLVIPNLGRGGAQKVFRDQFKFYSQHAQVYGCVFNFDNAFQDDKTNVMSLNVPAGRTWFDKVFFFLLRIWKIRRLKKKLNIHISISHLEGADYVNILSRRDETIVCWIHGTKEFDDNIEGPLGWLRKKIFIPWLYRKSNKLIAVSEGIRKELVSVFNLDPRLLQTIVNGFSLKEIVSKTAEPHEFALRTIANGLPVLITHCRLARQKNLESMLLIFSRLKDYRPSKLVILGDGELRESLLDYSRGLGLKTYHVWGPSRFNINYDVYFLGHQANPYPLLAQATLYLMTSSWEGFPLALGEAMACNVPVMASDCFTGPRELLEPQIALPQPITVPFESPQGFLMPLVDSKNNVEIWVETICNLLDDEERRQKLAISGKLRIAEFDLQRINEKWLQLIHE